MLFFQKKGFDFDDNIVLGGGFKHIFFNPIPGDMIQFD